jgi:ferritin-like metal-binding protein YciE
MRIGSLHELFLSEVHNAYDAGVQLTKAAPKLAEAAHYPELRSMVTEHTEQTKQCLRRLEEIMQNLGEKVQGVKCLGMRGLIEEGEHLAGEHGEPAPIDAGLTAVAQKIAHYQTATYGTLAAWADVMGHQRESELLKQCLTEEREIDRKLTDLAQRLINVDAARTGSRTRTAS